MASTALTAGSLPDGLMALPGVYRPQDDTRLVAEALAQEPLTPGAAVLEIGTGTGALALQAARRGARVTAVDVSWRAVATARLNALRQRLPLRVVYGDFASAATSSRFDLVVSNPPYVPAAVLPMRGPERAWDAGPDGRAVIDRICTSAPALLRPGGVLLLVHSGLCGAQETVERLTARGLVADVTTRTFVPWGPVLRSRRAWLEQQGLTPAAEELEELVVIRAQYL
ncbi:HemK2/MTQ2 family protein methyltransferase [Streptomyces avidinii]|uniref:Release factor glutamine methyltransferase n=1 Tax=Streptomyces avidinii TaxID=1895 RepID=A0ABS4KY55_STRAV|nr:HemK2/MTQ2 family protein methyltransferase [Streptomyces avidinii]MBP2034969.1 release factor glutamine methyltransferase [Streptomyces avidinii]GGY90135.1 methyltransferase [Streptomyces avidinii]